MRNICSKFGVQYSEMFRLFPYKDTLLSQLVGLVIEGQDYTVSYGTNLHVGTGTITITFEIIQDLVLYQLKVNG